MNVIYIIIYTAAAIEVILGVVVLLNDKSNKINQLFAVVTGVTAVWIISNALITLEPKGFWVRNAYATGILVSPIILIWIIRFITKKKIGKLKSIVIIGSAVFFSLITYLSDLIIKNVQTDLPGDFNGTFGPIFPIFAIYFIVISAYILFLVTKSFQKSKGLEKVQYRYIAFGLYGFGIIAAIVDFVLPIFGINFLILLDSPSSIIFIAALSLVILKHNLFNVKVVATELLVFSLWIIILVRTIISEDFTQVLSNGGLLVLTVIIGIFLIRSVIKEVSQREKIQILATDLQKVNDRLTELDRQKSEFVSFATHQLRAPLTAMKGYASLVLEGDMGKITKETRDAVGRIFESTNTLTSIVDDYLNVTRIELGTMKYAFETIDLKTLIEDVIAELKPNIDKSTNVNFIFGAENSGTDYRITADRDKLKQVFANLIDNSLKYTPKGSIGVSLSFNRSKHKFVFMIKDTGIGIAPETLPHLFNKFSRAGNANKTNIKGTGLGLFVAKEMIIAHHGTIRAESIGEGKGSTFIVEMEPFAKV